MNNIRAITLDLDDTLWSIGPVIQRAEEALWDWLARHYPRIEERWSPEQLIELRSQMYDRYPHKVHDFRFLRKKVLEYVALEVGYTTDLVDPAFAVFDAGRNRVDLFPEVDDELSWLADRYKLVAVTNGNANLHTIGIANHFHDIVTSVDVGAAKPARAIFDEAVRRTGYSPDQVLHVGDHPETDIVGAKKAGIRAVWVNRIDAPWPDKLVAPDATVTTLSELRIMLENA